MKRTMIVVLASFTCLVSYSQIVPASAALEGQTKTLQERYLLMKTKSESYQDYKVIKESIMDGVWKIGNDSLVKREQQLADANGKIKSLQNEVSVARTALKAKEDSMTDIVFASTHINVLGIGLSKVFFITLAALGLAGLTATILFLLARIKSMQAFVKESKVIVGSVTNEFEEYKRKSFEKQTKLNRELQTERNKVAELQSARKAV
ncbi:MAG TPA: hypothetical protein VL728_02075 [Cyclobacteriaceae bacterium]|nr:hypothetical protein [Cyclobacteriaceae bacterium]